MCHGCICDKQSSPIRSQFSARRFRDMHQAIGVALKTFEHEAVPFFAEQGMHGREEAARRRALSVQPA